MFLFVLLVSVGIASCSADGGVSLLSSPSSPAGNCPHRNVYIKQDGQCDTYIECKDYVAVQMSCPDGLHYNPAVAWPNYPCEYPMDAPCTGITQKANPTADCPHQYGYFPSPVAAPNDCGQYRFCMDGKPLELVCPTGLAFNPDTSRCDWADRVPSCNVEAFIGFKCPAPVYDEQGNALVTNHRYPGNCYSFFSCQADDLPRVLSCDAGLSFDEASGRCEDSDIVTCSTDAVPQ